MMTIQAMGPDQAPIYLLERDNGYQQKKAIATSKWWGSGAKLLGLDGAISNPAAFKNLCHGMSPDGTQQWRGNATRGEEVGGFDLCFSAPKSVSLACLIGGDDRLREAHELAVKATLKIIVERYLKRRNGKECVLVDGFNPIVALFEHDTSRKLDPNLHTHAFFLNLIQNEAGEWRAWSPYALKPYIKLMGQIYRNELAHNVQRLGYQIEPRKDGLFEIAGYTRSQIEQFSKRHEQILNRLHELGLEDTPENRIFCLFATREAKNQDVDREKLRSHWYTCGEASSFSHPIPVNDSISTKLNLQELIDQGIRHAEERTSVFPIEAIERWVMALPTGYSIEEINTAILSHPRILKKERELATEWSLERERQTIALMEEGKGTFHPFIPPETTPDYLSGYQLGALNLVIHSRDRAIAWEGVAGAGKTTTIKAVLDALKGQIHIMGIAPDASAAETLENETGMRCQTVASMLLMPFQDQVQRLVIVDEAGKLSAKDAHKLLKRSREEGFRVLFVGDTKQLSGVEAGNPFKALLDYGIATATLRDFKRQRDDGLLRCAQLLYYDMGMQSLQEMDGRGWIHEHSDTDQRLHHLFERWRDSNNRDGIRVIAGTHTERETLTALMRNQLRSEGMLDQGEHLLRVLRGKDLTEEQKQHARYYEVGDIVVPNLSQHRLRAGIQYVVAAVDGDTLTLRAGNLERQLKLGSCLNVPLKANVYQEKAIGVSTGDRLAWTKNNHPLSRINGKEATVVNIESGLMHVLDAKGQRHIVAMNQRQHLDHALVRTVYSSQGMTCDQVLVSMGLDQTVTREAILVALTRARYSAEFFVPDKHKWTEKIEVSGSQRNIQEWLEERGFKLKAPKPPLHIDVVAWMNRVEKSGIAPEIAELNVINIQGKEVEERLLKNRMEKLGAGQVNLQDMKKVRQRYKQIIDDGGAWNSGGIDAVTLPHLKPGQIPPQKTWGVLMPVSPRLDAEKFLEKGEPVQRIYEAPLDEGKGLFFPEIPPAMADRIYQKYNVSPTPAERASGFWPCAYWYPQIEVFVVDGKEKAESLFTQDCPAIGLPSTYGGYHLDGEIRALHPEMVPFVTSGRRVLIAFDQDEKEKTRRTVRGQAVKLGELMQAGGCRVDTVIWKHTEGKGPNDYIVNRGARAWRDRVKAAAPLQFAAESHWRDRYQDLASQVQRENGKAPNQKYLDVAIAMSAGIDAEKILKFSPALIDKGKESRAIYLVGIQEQRRLSLRTERKDLGRAIGH
jgi:conjugative relaxase-like TrwC/TraI family protein